MPVIKMLSRQSLSAIEHSISYALREGKTPGDQNQVLEPVLHNLRSDSSDIKNIVQEMVYNESFRKVTKNRVFCYHTILSLSEEDKQLITETKLRRIAEEYLELRGDVCAMAIPHMDTDSAHVHIIEGGTYYRENRSTTMRKEDLLKLKRELEVFIQKEYPELKHSRVLHRQNREYQTDLDYRLARQGKSKKQKLSELVLRCFERAKSQAEFLELLSLEGYLHYERNSDGTPTGIIDEQTGRKHRFKTLGLEPEKVIQLQNQRELTKEQELRLRLKKLREQDKDIEHNR